MTKILVTGGCGYIGSHLVGELVKSGEDVVVLDDLSMGNKSSLPKGVELIVGDITDTTRLEDVFAKYSFEAVFHLAALVNAAESVEKEDEYLLVNAVGSKNVWQEAVKSNVKYLIFASSAAVYGNPGIMTPINESQVPAPTNPYGLSKLLAEQSLLETTANTSTSYAALRFFNVTGAHDSGMLHQGLGSMAIMSRLFYAASRGEEIIISGNKYETKDGTVVRDFIHVMDIVSCLTSALKYLRSGGKSFVANLSTGKTTSMQQLHDIVEEVTGKVVPITFEAGKVGDIIYSLGDNTKAKKLLSWEPKRDITNMVESGWRAYVQATK